MQPLRLLGTIRQEDQRNHAEHDGRESFDEEQPLPTREPEPAVERQQRFRERSTDEHGDRRGRHEQRTGSSAFRRRNPVGQVQHHPGEEPCFGDAEQHPHRIEAPLPDDEHHRHRDEAPADHDSRDPDARADPLQDQVARDFEQAIAEEEQAAAESIRGIAQPEVALQLLVAKPMFTRSM